MIFNLRVLIVLAAITQFATLNFPPISPDWFQNQAKSQIAASQLAESSHSACRRVSCREFSQQF
jgi:hypothetical protein